MATTRAFTYNTGSRIEGNNQLGNLAYGARLPVNAGSNYSNNPGGKKWWMGPDEDDRYVIVKDVPTMDWPTQTPEGDIGSIRFWVSNDTDEAFRSMANNLPAREGLTPFATSREAYDWLISNGYYTNFDYDANEDNYYVIYNTPNSSTDSHIARLEVSFRNIVLDTNNNRLFAAPLQPNDRNPQYGNFFISNFTESLSIDNTIYYSGSTYINNYLTHSRDNTGGINDGDTIGQGFMAIDNDNEVLYVASTNTGAGGARGLIKYDLTDDSVIWSGPDNYTIPSQARVALDNSGDYLWLYSGATQGTWICRTTNGKFFNFVKQSSSSSLNSQYSYRHIIPGPANKALSIISSTNNADEEKDYYILSGSSVTSEPPYVHSSNNFPVNNALYIGKPIYLSSTNKWYIPYPGTGNDLRYNKIAVVDGNSYEITNTIKFGYSKTTTANGRHIDFFIYDSDRNYFWAPSAELPANNPNIVAISVDDEEQVFTSTTTFTPITGARGKGGVYTDDYLVFIGEITIGGLDRGVIQKIKVSDLV